jgi:hypothetical protein
VRESTCQTGPPIYAVAKGVRSLRCAKPSSAGYPIDEYGFHNRRSIDAIGRLPRRLKRIATYVILRAFYGKHRVTVNGKETVVTLPKAEGVKLLGVLHRDAKFPAESAAHRIHTRLLNAAQVRQPESLPALALAYRQTHL